MLASRGLRVCESRGEYPGLSGPVKLPLQKSLSAPQFSLEGATYLIVPTVVESANLPTAATGRHNTITRDKNIALATHRSISDSGDSEQRSNSPELEKANYVLIDASSECKNEICHEIYSPTASKTQNAAACKGTPNTGNASENSRQNGPQASVSQELQKSSYIEADEGRGYVEWRVCSVWAGKQNVKVDNGRDSRGYVEWDTIWAATAPWRRKTVDDKHVYEDVAGDPSGSFGERVKQDGEDLKTATAASADTPPTLPERTYINRLKSQSDRHSPQHSGQLLSPSQSHGNSSQHHPHHHLSNSCKKHHHCQHHHHHHHHHRNKHQKAIPSPPPPIPATLSQIPNMPEPLLTNCTGDTSLSAEPIQSNHRLLDKSQSYAVVQKLHGYKFSNLMALCEPPAPHRSRGSAVCSENYWRLEPVTSPDQARAWQTSDVLDFIDGFHQSMSPKRRENIYILISNKKTRAKFSESLEIESRLISKGLISSSCFNGHVNKVIPPEASQPGRSIVKLGIVKRKGALAPVTSTYV